jgi:hypothetical protein
MALSSSACRVTALPRDKPFCLSLSRLWRLRPVSKRQQAVTAKEKPDEETDSYYNYTLTCHYLPGAIHGVPSAFARGTWAYTSGRSSFW